MPDEVGEQASDLGDGERDQLLDRLARPLFPPAVRLAWAVVVVRKAWASMASVMCRYQPCQERIS